MEKRVYVGFPVPLLGPTPLRLPVLSNGRGVVALEKPAGLLATAHPWYAHFPNITDALGSQIRQSKPELTRLGIPYAKAIYHLDAEIAGPVLFGTSPASASRFRERFGSQELDFTFRLVARQRIAGNRFDISLPVAPHGTHPQLIVSRRKGKRAHTEFQCLERWGAYSLWEARCRHFRVHQVRLHAGETGLSIVGDRTGYSQSRSGYRVDFPLVPSQCLATIGTGL